MVDFIIVTLLSVAAMCDLFYAKIPNEVIATGLVSALLYHLINAGTNDLSVYLAGMMLPLLTGAAVYVFGVLGAGDIKLLCVVGAFLGVRGVLGSFGYAVLMGTVWGGIKMIIAGRWRRFPIRRVTIRFAVPILLGTLGVLIKIKEH